MYMSNKYLKYKKKYLQLKLQSGGANITLLSSNVTLEIGKQYKLHYTEYVDEIIDFLGFSDRHPGYFFEFKEVSGEASYKFVTVHEIKFGWDFPDSKINILLTITEGMKSKYKIVNEKVTDEKYKKYFENYRIIFSSENEGKLIRIGCGYVGGSFCIGNIYYLLGIIPETENFKNPRPDIKRINNLTDLAPFYIDEIGFSELPEYSNYWFDINIIPSSSPRHQTLRSMSIFNFDENLRMPSYKINSFVSASPESVIKYQINSEGIVTADKYKNFFYGIKLIIEHSDRISTFFRITKIE
jgi:hypothetical protein